ncbi:hypothetical protein K503DRAFT_767424, partial [Rhizopogon vinicolor AM-OR11-026]
PLVLVPRLPFVACTTACSISCSSFLFHSPARYYSTCIRYFLALNLNMVDPTAEVCPNFAAELYDNIQGDIHTTIRQPDAQIIDRLIQSWTEGHNRRVGEWNQQREEEEQAIAEGPSLALSPLRGCPHLYYADEFHSLCMRTYALAIPACMNSVDLIRTCHEP